LQASYKTHKYNIWLTFWCGMWWYI
jgi:hypothetical protein